MATLNSKNNASWATTRLEVVGWGRRFGTVPFGSRARAFHLTSTTFGTNTLTNYSGAYAAGDVDSGAISGSYAAG